MKKWDEHHGFVFIDVETSGLDPAKNRLLSLAMIVTNVDLEPIDNTGDIYFYTDATAGRDSPYTDPFVVDMHTKNGLWDKCLDRRYTQTYAAADTALVARLARFGITPDTPICLGGNSVALDRAFIQKYLPSLAKCFTYRNIDVSTVKELARRWHPKVFVSAPPKLDGHTASYDVDATVKELRHYRRDMMKHAPGRIDHVHGFHKRIKPALTYAQLWEAFSDEVVDHLQGYVVPQYGDLGRDVIAKQVMPLRYCADHIQRYAARLGRSSRQDLAEHVRDCIKIAHYAAIAASLAPQEVAPADLSDEVIARHISAWLDSDCVSENMRARLKGILS